MTAHPRHTAIEESVRIPLGAVTLAGDLAIPEHPHGLVLFAHGSGSSRMSPRNRQVACVLRRSGLATLLLDLLSRREEEDDVESGEFRFNIPLLADRLQAAADWLTQQPRTQGLPIGLFGASTGAGAALLAAGRAPAAFQAIVSRGGRPDLAGPALPKVAAPTLLIVGGRDEPVLRLNQTAQKQLTSTETALVVIPGATHLFEEADALDEVARLASEWFQKHLVKSAAKKTPR